MSTRKEIETYWKGFELGAKQGKTWEGEKWANIKTAIHNLRDNDLKNATPEPLPAIIFHMGNYFKVPSASEPGKFYSVTLDGTCNCKGYEVRKTCRHSELIKDLGKAKETKTKARLEESGKENKWNC